MKRKGNTGIWIFVMATNHDTIIATAEWGTNYEFAKACWEAMPLA